ncbi:hypothetical protein AB0L59_10675 [Streptomyces sp. NPDC052109]|uniref:hypothetical protein n=1 Tax=Streptomyces sp. NPDC052109 TaxID=3155527 RepID=UPI0034211D94
MRTLTSTAPILAAGAVPAAAAARTAPSGTDGVCRMDGHGTVLVLRGVLQEYQTTSVSCLKGDASRQTGPGTCTTTDGSVLTVRTAHDRDHALLAADSSVRHRRLLRLSALPADCALPADAHVAVIDGDRVFGQGRPGTEKPSPELDARVKTFVVARDLEDASHRQDFVAGRITYADLPG